VAWKVLLVDDEPDTLRTYSDLLQAENYEVACAASGEQALEMIPVFRPDVILLDIMLPGKNGIEVADELSRREDARGIPIILITALEAYPSGDGMASPPSVRRCIYKPCRPRTLLEGVHDVLRYGA